MHYRTVRKWAAAFYNLTYAEVELIITMHCKKRFTNVGFKGAEYVMSWDRHRFDKLKRAGWIDIYRNYWDTGEGKTIYKPSRKANEMVNKIYRILLGEEEIPVNRENPFINGKTYTDKVMLTAIELMKQDLQK